MKKGLRFWEYKRLEEMDANEWESLCDGCGQCCMHKLEDDDTGDIYFTSVACRLLDKVSCGCHNYQNRQKLVPDCIRLTPHNIGKFRWLPASCAYRLIYEGKNLQEWHHLISGRTETVHEAGISVRGKVRVYEDTLKNEDDYLSYITDLTP